MSLRDALLQDIVTNPDDDAPRLVFADWLDEHGEPDRAEFIRVQVRLASLAEEAPGRAALVERERALLAGHGLRWAEPLREPLGSGNWRFRRGFIEAVAIRTWPDVAQRLAQMVALAPIRFLAIDDGYPDAEALVAAAPAMARLRGLQFDYPNFHGQSRHVQSLLTSPYLAGLNSLYIVGDRNAAWLSKKALRAILTSPALAGLTQLTLIHDWDGLDGEMIRTLARTPRRANLKRLNLYSSRTISPAVMRELVSSRHLSQLTELDLSRVRMGRTAWEALAEAPPSFRLQRLSLADSWVCDASGTRLLADVGDSTLGMVVTPDEPLRQALLERFGPAVVDFSSNTLHRWLEDSWDGPD